ncbi:MAG: hypothetical protein KAI81_01345 [Candidatus Marinimicrobia bacterium]|nr:hypothetical protein [Candidatus Neomarinimicrobiota bacterium]
MIRIIFILIIMLSGAFANNLKDIKISQSLSEHIFELIFEEDVKKYDAFAMQSPPRVVIDIQKCNTALDGKSEFVELSPFYNYRISTWGAGKVMTKVVMEFTTLPAYTVLSNDRSIIVKWDKEEEEIEEIVLPKIKHRTNLMNKVSMQFYEAELQNVLRLLAMQNDLNIISGEDISGLVSITLNNVTVEQMLDAVLKVNGYNWFEQNGIIIVKPLETTLSGETITRIFNLDYVDANMIVMAIQNVLTDKGKAVPFSPSIKGFSSGMSGGSSGAMGSSGSSSGSLGALGGALGSLGGSSGSSNTMQNSGVGGASSGGTGATYDMLLVTDLEQNFRHIEDIIRKLDIPMPQINIAVKFIETKLDISEKMGINWNMRASVNGGPSALGSSLTMGKILPQGGSSAMGLATLTMSELAAVIEILSTSTESRLIQEPQITTADNNSAVIQVGTTYPIAVTQPATQFGPATVTFEEQEVNIVLNVTPHINEGKYISMSVNTQVEAVTGFAGPDLDRPIVSSRSTNTNIRIPNGNTLLIGGLILEQKIFTEKKVPILGSIPILGRLFKHTTSTPQRSELLLFITANIINLEK